jgi:tetratricopeptide (TPR) repeat protein
MIRRTLTACLLMLGPVLGHSQSGASPRRPPAGVTRDTVAIQLHALQRQTDSLRMLLSVIDTRITESRQMSDGAVATMKSIFESHLGTLQTVYVVAGVIFSLVGGAGIIVSFFGIRSWQDIASKIERIRQAESDIERAEAEQRQMDMIEKARFYIDCHQIDRALSILEELAKLPKLTPDARRHEVLLNRAVCYKRKKMYAQAYSSAREVAQEWDFAKAWYNAACYASLASTTDPTYKTLALECLRRAHELSPAYTKSVALGDVSYDNGADRKTPDRDLDNVRHLEDFTRLLGSTTSGA